MQIRVLTAADIRAALSMTAAIDAVERAYAQLSAGKATMPLRSRFHTQKGVTLLMPAHLHDSGDFAVKIVSVYADNPKLGLPTVAATVLALDPQTGMPLALMEGDSLTALRTGAAGGVAARYLARADAENVALFGAGVQARAQLQAAMAVRKIERVWIVDPFESTAQRLADDIAGWPDAPAVTLADSPQSAVAQADIVLAATTATTPLFDGNELKPGTHVTGVGSFTPRCRKSTRTPSVGRGWWWTSGTRPWPRPGILLSPRRRSTPKSVRSSTETNPAGRTMKRSLSSSPWDWPCRTR